MDNLDPLTDVMAQIATEQAALSKLCFIKERLENEVVAKKEELARAQCVKIKQEENRQPQKKQKTRQNTNTHSGGMSNNIYHGPNIASTSISTTHNVSVDETSVNAQKEHTNVDKSGPLTAV